MTATLKLSLTHLQPTAIPFHVRASPFALSSANAHSMALSPISACLNKINYLLLYKWQNYIKFFFILSCCRWWLLDVALMALHGIWGNSVLPHVSFTTKARQQRALLMPMHRPTPAYTIYNRMSLFYLFVGFVVCFLQRYVAHHCTLYTAYTRLVCVRIWMMCLAMRKWLIGSSLTTSQACKVLRECSAQLMVWWLLAAGCV